MSKESRLVYSTDAGRIKTPVNPQPRLASDGIVRLKRETAGRKGSGVIVIYGLPGDDNALKELAKALKKLCGTGGSVKSGTIEIQGDHREKIRQFLESRNYTVKLAGG